MKIETLNALPRADFVAAAGQLYPNAKLETDLLPKFGAGQYGTEISALLSQPAELTHSSLWGGDLQAFILQAGPRDLFKRTQVVLSAADHVLPGLGDKMPDGVILGARGAYGLMSQKSPLNDWFFKGYEAVNNVYPVQAAYRMTQAILGLKAADLRRRAGGQAQELLSVLDDGHGLMVADREAIASPRLRDSRIVLVKRVCGHVRHVSGRW